jgi:hypothetical protein
MHCWGVTAITAFVVSIRREESPLRMPMTREVARPCRYGYPFRVLRVVSRLVRLPSQRLAEVADQLFGGAR